MSPSDLQFINEIKHQFSNLISHIDDVTFEAEESIQSGGCIIETDLGEIDARIDKQLQAVEESFRAATEKPSGGG
jgi:flagellar assembly protein FliH